ncbi:MAG: hypothetical protein AB1585_13330 [Thermodesulfobacteriota bacterium]
MPTLRDANKFTSRVRKLKMSPEEEIDAMTDRGDIVSKKRRDRTISTRIIDRADDPEFKLMERSGTITPQEKKHRRSQI